MRLLLVEDFAALRLALLSGLQDEGYAVDAAADGGQGWWLAERNTYDLVILDIMLPGIDGLEILRRLRARPDGTPVLLLTARDEVGDRVRGLDLGADDYLTKPFSPRTLLARVKALLRRAGMETGGPLNAGPLSLDLEGLSLRVGEAAPMRLTKLETRLLQILIANAGHVVGTERLLTHVWGHRGSGDRQLLKQLVHRLRHKLETDPAAPQMLKTEPGAGYRLDTAGS